MSSHGREAKPDQDPEDDDPVDSMLRKAGCLELNDKLAICANEHKDWRKCQDILLEFKECMDFSKKKHFVEKPKD